MKKITLSLTVLFSVALYSCSSSTEKTNEEDHEAAATNNKEAVMDPVCECADKVLVIAKAMLSVPEEEKIEAMGNMIKDMEAIMVECKTVFEEIDKQIEGLSEADKKVKEDELKERCPSIKELEDLKGF